MRTLVVDCMNCNFSSSRHGGRLALLVLMIVVILSLTPLSYSTFVSRSAYTIASFIPSANAQVPSENVTVTVMHTGVKFDVDASLSNGIIKNATLYPEFNYIVFDLATSDTDAGELTVTLPRTLIDSKSEDLASDGTFTVVLDDYETSYAETNSDNGERTLTISIAPGVVEATVVGTQVLPEFPAIVLLITAAAIAFIIGFGRLTRNSHSIQSR